MLGLGRRAVLSLGYLNGIYGYLTEFCLGHRNGSILRQKVGVEEDGGFPIERILDVHDAEKSKNTLNLASNPLEIWLQFQM